VQLLNHIAALMVNSFKLVLYGALTVLRDVEKRLEERLLLRRKPLAAMLEHPIESRCRRGSVTACLDCCDSSPDIRPSLPQLRVVGRGRQNLARVFGPTALGLFARSGRAPSLGE